MGTSIVRTASVVILFGASAPGVHATPCAIPVPSEDEVEPELWSRLQRIEGAFRNGDAGALRSWLSTGKVRADLKGVTGGQASYGPGQLQVVFGQMFEEFLTREFSFRKNDVKVSASGTAFARGRWVRAAHSGGREIIENLTFTLGEEDWGWRILEIRTSP